MKQHLSRFRARKTRRLFLGIVFLIGSLVLVSVLFSSKTADAPVITHSTRVPVESVPTKQTFTWRGASNDPKYITLPTINAGGFIQNAGVDQNNEIATPNNVHMAAWFVKSARPGDPGLSIIDGHVHGRVNNGIFKDLAILKTGDTFSVELGSGKIANYQVIRLQTVVTADAVNFLFSQEPGVNSQLNLITCGGTYDKITHSFDHRVIVYAKVTEN